MKRWLAAVALAGWVGVAAWAAPIAPFPVASYATADKPQSKCWYHDGSWWAILSDGVEGARFYRLVDGVAWRPCAFPHALVSPDVDARADVCAAGYSLTALVWRESGLTARHYVCIYGKEAYYLRPVWAATVDLPTGHETATIALRPGGHMVAAAVNGHVLVATPGANAAPTTLASGLAADDIAAIVAFGPADAGPHLDNGRVGVFWSDQNTQSLGFRWRAGTDPAGEWRPTETVAQGGHVADDHINMAAASDGALYVVTKTSVDDVPRPVDGPTQAQIIPNVRAPEGGWRVIDVVPVTDVFTSRPIVVLDETNDELYVFYRHGDEIRCRVSSREGLDFSGCGNVALSKTGVTLRNVTSAKHAVNASMGLLVMATGSDGMAYSAVLPLDAADAREGQ